MKSFRNPIFVERYEDVLFDMETTTAITTTLGNNEHQTKVGFRFIVDNSGEHMLNKAMFQVIFNLANSGI